MITKYSVCHITSVHKSNDVRILLKECSSLASNGFEVNLVVANAISENINNVNIIGVSSNINSRIGRIIKTVYRVYKVAKSQKSDIYHLHDPELLFIALFLKNKKNKVLFDAHEDLPRQILTKYWIPTPSRKVISIFAEVFEDFIVKRLDGVVAATPFIRDRFKKINFNTVDINNYPLLEELSNLPSLAKKENLVVYIGGITKERGIVELVKALPLCKSKVILNLAGDFSPIALKDVVANLEGWKSVNYVGFVGRQEVKKMLSVSKVGLVTLYPTSNYLDSLPIKMFEYMACGLPLVVSNFPYWIELLKNESCAVFVDPKNENEIASALDYLLENDKLSIEMGQRGRQSVLLKFNWEIEEKKLLNFYKSMLS